jgi:hypothetical protein
VTPTIAAVLRVVPQGAQTGALGDTLFAARDSLAGAAGAIRDTLSRAPLPGGVAALFRFFFQVPQWIQIGGVVVAAVVAALLVMVVWRRRAALLTWLGTRSREIKLTLASAVLFLLAGSAFLGAKSWDYMQHNNGFCTGCHIMERPFRRFAAGAGKHEDLKCHDCHQQSIWASSWQLILWVGERPEKIGVHAPVPNSRCEGCHQLSGGREPWQHVRRLAGHRVHFESDSTVLKHLQCVKCHGAEVHQFLPSTRTCDQSGCHEKQTVKLAGMAKLPEISCVTCHAFTADLPGLATRDSARRALVPTQTQCLGCHQMRGKPSGFDLAKDPHRGSCGYCHDVHAHSRPEEARRSCAKCHAEVAKEAFHSGANHRRVQAECLTCHLPHAATVDASDCVGCHNQVRKRGRFRPPLPFDTAAVIRGRIAPSSHPPFILPAVRFEEHAGKGDALPEELPPPRDSPTTVSPIPPDSFPHNRHTSLACLTCHTVNRPGRGLVFEAPRGCDLCHHQSLTTGRVDPKDCARCHRVETLAAPRMMQVRVQVGARQPAARAVAFGHDRHSRFACAECHRPPETAPPDSVRSCRACHDQHHAPERDCVQCHNRNETRPAHTRATHVGCDDCHTPARIAALVPARNFCVTCHVPQREHRPDGECSNCHFLEAPAQFRRHLLGKGAG